MFANKEQIFMIRKEAERWCNFDFDAFDDYREIDESQLTTGQFFDDELELLKSDQRNKQMQAVFLGIFFLLYAILVAVFMPYFAIWLIGGALLISFVVYGLILLRKRSNKIHHLESSLEGLMRGVVVYNTIIRYMRLRRRLIILSTVFFPESMTFIKYVRQDPELYPSIFQEGDKVVVYKLVGDLEAKMLSTTHLEMNSDLLERASTARTSRSYTPYNSGYNRNRIEWDSYENRKPQIGFILLIWVILALLIVIPAIILFWNMSGSFFRIFNMMNTP